MRPCWRAEYEANNGSQHCTSCWQKLLSALTAAWKGTFRPWFSIVSVCGLFLMSLIQSVAFFTRYFDPPIATSTILRRLTPEDTPWITICPVPGYSPAKLINKYVLGENGTVDRNGVNWEGLQIPAITNVTIKHGISPDDFLNDVGLPLWSHLISCQVRFTNKTIKTACNRLVKGSSIRYQEAMEYETSTGKWETDFLLLKGSTPPVLTTCTTLRPSFSLDAEEVEEVVIAMTLTMDRLYRFNDTVLKSKLLARGYAAVPRYIIRLTEPYTRPSVYQALEMKQQLAGRDIIAGERVKVRPTVERFNFLNTPTHPCTSNEEELNQAHECIKYCVESTYLSSSCRLPGYRRNFSSFPFELPPICVTRHPVKYCDDQVTSTTTSNACWEFDWDRTGRSFQIECQNICQHSCSRVQYAFRETVEAIRPIENITTVWDEATASRSTILQILPISTHAKIIEQRYDYDAHQLVGDLGGSWGLFLGLSFIQLLAGVASLVEIILQKLSS